MCKTLWVYEDSRTGQQVAADGVRDAAVKLHIPKNKASSYINVLRRYESDK